MLFSRRSHCDNCSASRPPLACAHDCVFALVVDSDDDVEMIDAFRLSTRKVCYRHIEICFHSNLKTFIEYFH